jgi:hypothetical protein
MQQVVTKLQDFGKKTNEAIAEFGQKERSFYREKNYPLLRECTFQRLGGRIRERKP